VTVGYPFGDRYRNRGQGAVAYPRLKGWTYGLVLL
jgi:hypothetical protein